MLEQVHTILEEAERISVTRKLRNQKSVAEDYTSRVNR